MVMLSQKMSFPLWATPASLRSEGAYICLGFQAFLSSTYAWKGDLRFPRISRAAMAAFMSTVVIRMVLIPISTTLSGVGWGAQDRASRLGARTGSPPATRFNLITGTRKSALFIFHREER